MNEANPLGGVNEISLRLTWTVSSLMDLPTNGTLVLVATGRTVTHDAIVPTITHI